MDGRCTFDRRVIFVDEVRLDQLDCEAGLSHTTASDDDQLVFPQELRHDMLVVLLARRRWLYRDFYRRGGRMLHTLEAIAEKQRRLVEARSC